MPKPGFYTTYWKAIVNVLGNYTNFEKFHLMSNIFLGILEGSYRMRSKIICKTFKEGDCFSPLTHTNTHTHTHSHKHLHADTHTHHAIGIGLRTPNKKQKNWKRTKNCEDVHIKCAAVEETNLKKTSRMGTFRNLCNFCRVCKFSKFGKFDLYMGQSIQEWTK